MRRRLSGLPATHFTAGDALHRGGPAVFCPAPPGRSVQFDQTARRLDVAYQFDRVADMEVDPIAEAERAQ